MSLLSLLAQDKSIITYRKELNEITGGVMATILLQQLIYWSDKNDNKPFYKFVEPCENEKYKNGDSWTEELGFTKKEFTGAYKKLQDLNIVSKKINMMRVTFYTLNIDVLSKLIKGIYISDKRELMEVTKGDLDYSKSFDTETTTETTTDIIKEYKEKIPSLVSDIEEKLSTYSNININSFYEWIETKKFKSIAPVTKVLNFLSNYDMQTQQQIVDASIMNGWKGLFEPKTNSNNTKSFKQQDREQKDKEIDTYLNSGYSLRDDLAGKYDIEDVYIEPSSENFWCKFLIEKKNNEK